MGNGTVTLECALEALGIGPGDAVIVPALTGSATAMAACIVAGAKLKVSAAIIHKIWENREELKV